MKPQRELSQDLFADLAHTYEEWYSTPLGSFVASEEERALVASLPEPPGRLLEVGAGTGWWSRVLARRGFAATALEPSAAMRAVDEEQSLPAVEWLAGMAECLPFADARFDVVVLMTVLEFVSDPPRAMTEAWRVLRPGGRLIVGHLDPASPWVALYRRRGEERAAPWSGATFFDSDRVAAWLGRPPDERRPCVFLGPDASPPYEAADRAGRAAGNAGALAVLCWRKSW